MRRSVRHFFDEGKIACLLALTVFCATPARIKALDRQIISRNTVFSDSSIYFGYDMNIPSDIFPAATEVSVTGCNPSTGKVLKERAKFSFMKGRYWSKNIYMPSFLRALLHTAKESLRCEQMRSVEITTERARNSRKRIQKRDASQYRN